MTWSSRDRDRHTRCTRFLFRLGQTICIRTLRNGQHFSKSFVVCWHHCCWCRKRRMPPKAEPKAKMTKVRESLSSSVPQQLWIMSASSMCRIRMMLGIKKVEDRRRIMRLQVKYNLYYLDRVMIGLRPYTQNALHWKKKTRHCKFRIICVISFTSGSYT